MFRGRGGIRVECESIFFSALVYNCVGAVHVREAREREHVGLPQSSFHFGRRSGDGTEYRGGTDR